MCSKQYQLEEDLVRRFDELENHEKEEARRRKKSTLPDLEEEIEARLQNLATYLAPMYSKFVPEAYLNMVRTQAVASVFEPK